MRALPQGHTPGRAGRSGFARDTSDRQELKQLANCKTTLWHLSLQGLCASSLNPLETYQPFRIMIDVFLLQKPLAPVQVSAGSSGRVTGGAAQSPGHAAQPERPAEAGAWPERPSEFIEPDASQRGARSWGPRSGPAAVGKDSTSRVDGLATLRQRLGEKDKYCFERIYTDSS